MAVEIIPDLANLRLAVITRHDEGWPIRQLARHYGISRNRVRRILRRAQRHRRDGPDVLPPTSVHRTRGSKLDDYLPAMKSLLEEYPKLTGVRMLEELRLQGYDGGLTILRERLKGLRPEPTREPEVRFETEPGVQGQMDWSPYTIRFTKTGKTKVLCFSYLLGFSRRQYLDFTLTRDFHTLIRRHRDSFEYFGGVVRQCLYDSEKTVVLRWEGGQPIFNPSFIDFITHYRCRPIACQRGRAKTKGKVERPFQYVEGNLLNGRTFRDLEELRATARWWMQQRSDTHIHDTTGQAPLELFMAQEQSCLQPLLAYPHDCAEIVFRVGRADGFVEFETNLYSIPYTHMGEILTVKACEREVLVYTPYVELVACHERLPNGAGREVESPDHRHSPTMRYGLEPVREVFCRLGEAAEEFLEGLTQRHPRHPGMHARLILQLKQHYHIDDINGALRHAVGYYAFDAAAVQRILKAKAKPRTLESLRNDTARSHLDGVMPAVKQRSLDEYSRMLNNGESHEQDHGGSCPDQASLPNAQPHGDGENAG